ncbi:MAG: hypothetical protein QOG95_3508, partial [Mycobacterium sp.]|nr:hypothetical protein [Mycobacterium sp.]
DGRQRHSGALGHVTHLHRVGADVSDQIDDRFEDLRSPYQLAAAHLRQRNDGGFEALDWNVDGVTSGPGPMTEQNRLLTHCSDSGACGDIIAARAATQP